MYKSVEGYEGCYSNKYQDHVPCSFVYNVVCVDDEFTKPILVFRAKMLLMNSLRKFLKKVMKKRFNKNFIMSEKEEEQFQSSNIC